MAYYRSKPALERHPLHIELVASRFGVSPRRLDAGARVLELGCGAGDNILALAYSHPEAFFCGIDSSEEAIAEARRGADALGLSNVDFVSTDFQEANAQIAHGCVKSERIDQRHIGSGKFANDTSDGDSRDSGKFEKCQIETGEGVSKQYDYVICHGVYSWVSLEVQKVLRQVIARHLKPSGVCYLSFNCLPGITPRLTLRRIINSLWSEAEREHEGDTHRVGAIPVSFARKQMQELLGAIEQRADLYGSELHRELRELLGQSDEFWEVDLLGNDNNPSYLDDVIGDFADVGLSYIADAKPARNRRDRLVGKLLGGIESGDGGANDHVANDRQPVARRLGNDVVLDDLLSPLGFRAALFTPTNGQRRVAVRGMEKLPYIQNLYISSKLVKVSEVAPDLKADRGVAIYCDPKGREIKVRDKVVGLALDILAERFPLAVKFSELVKTVESQIGVSLDAAAVGILEMFVESKFSMGQIDCHLQPPHCVNTVSDYPEVFAPARYQVAEFGWGTNTRHEYAQFDEFEREVVPMFTGLTHVSELLERVEEMAMKATPNAQQIHSAEHVERVKEEYVRRSGNLLLRLAEEGFLVR